MFLRKLQFYFFPAFSISFFICMATFLTFVPNARTVSLFHIIKSAFFGSAWNLLLEYMASGTLFLTWMSLALTRTTTSDILSSFNSLNNAASIMLILFFLVIAIIFLIISGWLMELSLIKD